jgi:2-polyprenyl-3-methyl-5-hydroxy-6-metoxy-1,4-benzoquinol methylase
MRYRGQRQQSASETELLRAESSTHDEIYADSYPFWSDSLEIDPERVESIFQPCYRPETLVHGRRKRRMLELLDVPNIAGKAVLDVGCGNGAYSVYLAMHGATVHGFDISMEGIRTARAIAAANGVTDRCSFTRQSASSLSYPSEAFDTVLCSNVLHHIWKYDGVPDELCKVLDTGGTLVFDEGIRSNPVYRVGRDAYQRLTGQEGDLGDIDLEYSDLTAYGERFSETYIESLTLLSGMKNFVGETFDNPASLRALFRGAVAVDTVLEDIEALDPYCLEVVGRFEK